MDERQVRLELLELELDVRHHLQGPLEPDEGLAHLVQLAPPGGHVVVHLLGRELEERPVHPHGVGALEVGRRGP